MRRARHVLATCLTILLPTLAPAADFGLSSEWLRKWDNAEVPFEDLDRIERNFIARHPQLARRSTSGLRLRRADGKLQSVSEITGDDACEAIINTNFEACRQLRVIGFWPQRHVFLLAVRYYEGHGVLLVDAKGGEHTIAGMPRISPNRRLIAATTSDCDLNGGDVVEVYDVRGGFTPQLTHNLSYEAATVLRWEGSDRFLVEVAGCDEFYVPGRPRTTIQFRRHPQTGWSSERLP